MKQRLRGWGGNLSRQAGGRVGSQGGGIGGRGPGETKIETDRRRINTKIAKLRRELAHMQTTRDTKRSGRSATRSRAWRSPATPTPASPRCSTGSPTPACWSRTRCSRPSTRPPGAPQTGDGRIYTMSDTVGFVRHLPHQLVEAFRSTLEEVADSDLIVHVVDGSHPDPEGQLAAVREVLAEIGADKVPELVVINKADVADPLVLARLRQREPHSVVVSAKTGEGIAEALRRDRGRPAATGGRGRGAAALRPGRPAQPDARQRRGDLARAHRRGHAAQGAGQRGAGRRARAVPRQRRPHCLVPAQPARAAPPVGPRLRAMARKRWVGRAIALPCWRLSCSRPSLALVQRHRRRDTGDRSPTTTPTSRSTRTARSRVRDDRRCLPGYKHGIFRFFDVRTPGTPMSG